MTDGLELIRHFGLKLTAKQLDVLRTMAAHADDEDGELVVEGQVAYLADECVSGRTVTALLRACAITPDQYSDGKVCRFHINGTGRAIVDGKEYREVPK